MLLTSKPGVPLFFSFPTVFVVVACAFQNDPSAYYAVITRSAERAVPGCAAAVRFMLAATIASASSSPFQSVADAAQQLNVCAPLPSYVASDLSLFLRELNMAVMVQMANMNMGTAEGEGEGEGRDAEQGQSERS